jgi:hypothetical protein
LKFNGFPPQAQRRKNLSTKYAEGVRQFQPGVASTLGFTEKSNPTLKAFANDLANAFSVEVLFLVCPRVEATLG